MKKCSQCLETKELSEFHRHSGFSDGRTSKCKVCRSKNWKSWYADNGEKVKSYSKDYYEKNKEYVLTRNKEYFSNKKKNDIQFRIACNLRSRLSKAISQKTKTGSAAADLGCSLKEFRKHIQSKFKDGMSWDNYGDWHLDHIMPLSSFDLTNEGEFREAVHFSNIQPLWANENLSKGARI